MLLGLLPLFFDLGLGLIYVLRSRARAPGGERLSPVDPALSTEDGRSE